MLIVATIIVFISLLTVIAVIISRGWKRAFFEPIGLAIIFTAAAIALITTAGIFLSVLYETVLFFSKISPLEFLFSLNWSPQISIREDQVGSTGEFGFLPVMWGTFFISFIAMVFATPLGLFTAIYLSEYAGKRTRNYVKPFLETLSGIPTVVYGFLAAILVGPLIRSFADSLGFTASSESALAAGLMIGVMIIPMICSLSDDAMRAVPSSIRDGALGLGSTRSEMITKVVIPAALPGIFSGVLLAVSRAIGETMIVVMAAGLIAKFTANPFEAVTTASVQIVTLLIGDQEFDDPKTLAAFALGLALFLITLVMNMIALNTVRKFRETYE